MTQVALAAATLLLACAPVSAQERAARVVRGEQVYTAHMPRLELTADDIESLAAYLASSK